MTRVKVKAAQEGISLKEFFVSAIEDELKAPAASRKRRVGIPTISTGGIPVRDLTRDEMADAMLPIPRSLGADEPR
ncbi:MAG: hypothetical protein RL328_1066 [Acidobacteriota bacterium]